MFGRLVLVLAMVLVAVWSRSACAEPTRDPLERFRSDSLELRITAFGWSGFDLYRAGAIVDEDYKAVFAASPGALDVYRSYRTLTTTGTILVLTGTAVAVAGLVFLVRDSHPKHVSTLGLGLALGGLTVDLGGTVLFTIGRLRINDAVQRFNEDLYNRLRSSPQATRNLSLAVTARL